MHFTPNIRVIVVNYSKIPKIPAYQASPRLKHSSTDYPLNHGRDRLTFRIVPMCAKRLNCSMSKHDDSQSPTLSRCMRKGLTTHVRTRWFTTPTLSRGLRKGLMKDVVIVWRNNLKWRNWMIRYVVEPLYGDSCEGQKYFASHRVRTARDKHICPESLEMKLRLTYSRKRE